MAGRTWADDWAAWRIRAEAELRQATSNGTLPSIDRRYTSDDQGAAAAREEASILDGHGYEPTMRSEQGGEIKVANVLLLGALAALPGQARTAGTFTVTYRLRSAPPSSSAGEPADLLRKLADLHSAGVLTDEEFRAKKAQLLTRM